MPGKGDFIVSSDLSDRQKVVVVEQHVHQVFAGALLWILSLVLGGYLFGNIPVVRRNFSLVIFAIIILSILPGIIEVWRQRGRAGTTAR
jgi:membrane protein DedA with SNARE-associated domain